MGPTERDMRSTKSLNMILILSTILGIGASCIGVTSNGLDTSTLTASEKIAIASFNLQAFMVFR